MAVGMEKCRLSWEILGGTHGEKLATFWTEEGRATPSFRLGSDMLNLRRLRRRRWDDRAGL